MAMMFKKDHLWFFSLAKERKRTVIWFLVHLNLSRSLKNPYFPPWSFLSPNMETWQICNRVRELCWRCTESIAGRGTSKLPELCKVAEAFKPCHFTEILFDHQANFHNLDPSSVENTEWHDQKTPVNQWTNKKFGYLPLLTVVNKNEILFQNL